MGALAQAIGSGAALVMFGIAWLINKHQGDLHHKMEPAKPWLRRTRTVVMFMGGAALAVTIFGGWIADVVLWLVSFSGSWGPAVLKIFALALLATTVIGILKAWSHAGLAAAVLPIVLSLFANGFFHNLDNEIGPKARDGSTQVSDWLGNPKGK